VIERTRPEGVKDIFECIASSATAWLHPSRGAIEKHREGPSALFELFLRERTLRSLRALAANSSRKG